MYPKYILIKNVSFPAVWLQPAQFVLFYSVRFIWDKARSKYGLMADRKGGNSGELFRLYQRNEGITFFHLLACFKKMPHLKQ